MLGCVDNNTVLAMFKLRLKIDGILLGNFIQNGLYMTAFTCSYYYFVNRTASP